MSMFAKVKTPDAHLMLKNDRFVALNLRSSNMLRTPHPTEIQFSTGELRAQTKIQRHSRVIDMEVQFLISRRRRWNPPMAQRRDLSLVHRVLNDEAMMRIEGKSDVWVE